jgi:hypothetical protein
MHTYEFQNLKVQYGSLTVIAKGYAHYDLEDIGEGHYEFWGEKGKDEYILAHFTKSVLQDYNLKGKKSAIEIGLTHLDKKNIESLIVDTLNEDTLLCLELPVEEDPEEKE